ncbi:MAG TPA: cupredoxin domain-containing protein [Candidatus Eisenbacteria bacterium]|nr:cupredoxin domain-containing protein [Candidatus Eisenbacteria bacterium]
MLKAKKSVSALILFSCLTMLLASGASARPGETPIVEITAKRFAFSPDKITLKKDQTVKLRLHSEDVTHGFFLRQLALDEEIPAGQSVDVTVTPRTGGTFTTICDHFCGANHGNMNMTIVVE